MPLHPEAAAFLEQISRQKSPRIETLPIDITRRAALVGTQASDSPPDLARTQDLNLKRPDGTDLLVRVYCPRAVEPLPICLYFHGGGWVLNSIETHDDLVRRLAAESGCLFVNIEYRLAPEHKYPAAIDDSWLALNWVHDHAQKLGGDPNQIAVAGDSAGGNLAAALCLMSRDRKGPEIGFQALIYPITDCDFDRPSYRENAEGYFLTRREMIWFWNHYVSSPEQMKEPYASPLRASSLRNLPPALILTAEFDPLRDEGEAYADALRAAGVDVEMLRFDGMIHAFVRRVQQFSGARAAIQKIADRLRAVFHCGRASI